MFGLLNRYIFQELIEPFLFGLGAFTAILASSMVLFDLVRAIVLHGMPVFVAAQIFIYRLPGIVVYIFPMAILLAALLAFARFSHDSEIIAFRASGISLYRLMIPVLFLGLLVSFTNLLFSEVVVPEANTAAKNLVTTTSAAYSPKIKKNLIIPELEKGALKRMFYAGTVSGEAMIGVVIQEVTKELADSFGLSKPAGALISAVEPASPAEKAGLEASDVVLKYDGKTVNSSSELPRLVGATHPGSKVMMQVWRKGAVKDVVLTVGEVPAEKAVQRAAKGGKSTNRLGLALSNLSPEQKQQLKVRNGVLVEDAEGAAARSGIRRGDVIMAVNNNDVKNVEQFNQMLTQFSKGRNVALLVKRGDSAIYVPLKVNGD